VDDPLNSGTLNWKIVVRILSDLSHKSRVRVENYNSPVRVALSMPVSIFLLFFNRGDKFKNGIENGPIIGKGDTQWVYPPCRGQTPSSGCLRRRSFLQEYEIRGLIFTLSLGWEQRGETALTQWCRGT
jgi:hypothetical protein